MLFEVHATSNYRMFVDDVLARAEELRRRYTHCGCAFALTTLLRCARRRVRIRSLLRVLRKLTLRCARAVSPWSRR